LGVLKWKKNYCNTTPQVPLAIWNERRTTPNNTTPQVPLEIWKDHILGCKSL
jgi:hypothetical protein